jgi:hypothetical protein
MGAAADDRHARLRNGFLVLVHGVPAAAGRPDDFVAGARRATAGAPR